jgi:hypothetical protein
LSGELRALDDSRPMIRVADYLELVERSTYGPGRVRP